MNVTERHAKLLPLALLVLTLLPRLSFAEPYYGGTFSYAASSKDPANLHGYQLMLNYDPQRFKWRQFNVYFDGGFSYFSTNGGQHSAINIYSVAPVIRYTFKRRGPLLPFLELSIGVSYMNHTNISDRNLGIHFAFQDRMGIGALLGASENISLGLHAVHYSNAHLAKNNAGITVPIMLDVGYRFQ